MLNKGRGGGNLDPTHLSKKLIFGCIETCFEISIRTHQRLSGSGFGGIEVESTPGTLRSHLREPQYRAKREPDSDWGSRFGISFGTRIAKKTSGKAVHLRTECCTRARSLARSLQQQQLLVRLHTEEIALLSSLLSAAVTASPGPCRCGLQTNALSVTCSLDPCFLSQRISEKAVQQLVSTISTRVFEFAIAVSLSRKAGEGV
jgi:hypothetical protein